MKWKIIDRGKNSSKSNMEFDAELIQTIDKSAAPTLHFYEFSNPLSATYGYFIKPEKFFKTTTADIARRPTGGGIILHGYDFTFSIIIPKDHPGYSVNPLSNYSYINTVVAQAVSEFTEQLQPIDLLRKCSPAKSCLQTNFCMARPTIYDLIIEGKKVGGAAIRRKKEGYLYQGSLALTTTPQEIITSLLLDGETLVEDMTYNTYPLIPAAKNIEKAREELKILITNHFIKL